ncbi:MAG TPA: glutathione S-transferase family protein [Candidatus Polarisedimenticolaceae bacterium]|nr:glutathione S-transferase family protein [Candidatus Polarisedimenticolaceae bacterium]
MLKLHHLDRSPFGWKVRMVLAEKDVPHELVIPDNKTEDPAFAKLNPYKLTPVLELPDGRSLYESTVINEYLEEAFPQPPMLPKDPYERARIRMLEDTTDQYLYTALRELRAAQFEYAPPYLVRKKPDEIDHKALEGAKAKVHQHLARLEAELSGRNYFGGDIFSLADAGLVPPLTASLPLLSILPDDRYPALRAWALRVNARPSVRASAPKVPLRIRD